MSVTCQNRNVCLESLSICIKAPLLLFVCIQLWSLFWQCCRHQDSQWGWCSMDDVLILLVAKHNTKEETGKVHFLTNHRVFILFMSKKAKSHFFPCLNIWSDYKLLIHIYKGRDVVYTSFDLFCLGLLSITRYIAPNKSVMRCELLILHTTGNGFMRAALQYLQVIKVTAAAV